MSTFVQIGVDYCRQHFGTRNEDDSYKNDDGTPACDHHDDEDTTPCLLVPLGYIAPPPTPSETCATCGQPIWLNVTWVPWAPDARFHIACDTYAKRGISALLAGRRSFFDDEAVT